MLVDSLLSLFLDYKMLELVLWRGERLFSWCGGKVWKALFFRGGHCCSFPFYRKVTVIESLRLRSKSNGRLRPTESVAVFRSRSRSGYTMPLQRRHQLQAADMIQQIVPDQMNQ